MDLLNMSAAEKLGLADFLYATQTVPQAQQYEQFGGFIIPPATPCIVTGFAPMLTSANTVLVNGTTDNSNAAGQAFLGWMDTTGTPRYGMVVANNSQAQALSLAGLTAGASYNVYIRFNYVAGASQNRAYEANPSSGQQYEYANLTPTRLQAIWEMRVELATLTMTSEWLLIANIVIGSGSTATKLTDLRKLYFEGVPSSGYTPAWGTTADRSSTRSAANNGAAKIADLRTELDALRQCIVDIKGPGLQPWYSSAIGGINIGAAFAASPASGLAQTVPTDATVALGDRGFLIQGVSAITGITQPVVYFNQGVTGAGSFRYTRNGGAADTLGYYSNGAPAFGVTGGLVGVGNVSLAPQAPLHVQGYTSSVAARFDGPPVTGGNTAVQVVGWNAGDLVYLSYGDTANPAGGGRRSLYHLGIVGTGEVFGLTATGTSPPVYWQYNPSTSVTLTGPSYTPVSTSNNTQLRGSFQNSSSVVVGQHTFNGYVSMPNGASVNGVLGGNYLYFNVVSVNGTAGGARTPGLIMGTNTTMFAYTSLNTGFEFSPDLLPVLVASISTYGSNPSVQRQAGAVTITNVQNSNGNCLLTLSQNLPSSAVVMIADATPGQSGSNASAYSQGPGGNQITVIFSTTGGGNATPAFSIVIYALGF